MNRNAFAFVSAGNDVRQVPLQSIEVRDQVRKEFNEDKIRELAESIQTDGLLHPLAVRMTDTGYLLVAGERRYRALKMLNTQQVPVIVLRVDDDRLPVIQMVENLLREDLNPVERTEGLIRLLSQQIGHPEDDMPRWLRQLRSQLRKGSNDPDLSENVKKVDAFFREFKMNWESFVAVDLRNLTMPQDIKDLCRSDGLEITKAREISRVNDAHLRVALARRAIEEKMPLAKVRAEVAPHVAVRRNPVSREGRQELEDVFKRHISQLSDARRETATKRLNILLDTMYPQSSQTVSPEQALEAEQRRQTPEE